MASYLQARQQVGLWFLRIDDIDPPREPAGTSQHIIETLRAHGFVWNDEVRFQSAHSQIYERSICQLEKSKAIYNCRCTRKQIQTATSAQQGSIGASLVYPGTCRDRKLSAVNTAIRFKVSGCVEFVDQLQGRIVQNLNSEVGDFVIKRRDGLYSYQLANVVDDITDEITHIVRGSDLLDNTPRQIQLGKQLGGGFWQYLHVPVAVFPSGEKLSKQTRAPALPPDRVLESLALAWRFLGQTETLVYSSVASFWDQALQHWNAERIPAKPEQLAPAALR